ncbi:MAG: hemerythrin domain-containing protein [Deltaproteobacteria bacterium]|nr:hemerythrin domain-containing protein [Deltaproteobacteria bacterium]
MDRLISEFQRDHVVIMDTLNVVKRHGLSSREGKDGLNSVRDTLLAHLKKEDAHLYPVLRKAAEKDEALKQTLDLFAKDMAEISNAALKFFAKYAAGGAGTEFARDFGGLYATLQGRIRKEENNLYKAYEKLNP